MSSSGLVNNMFSSDLINRIRSTYATNNNVEIEIRFGEFRGRDFKGGISWRAYERINNYFSNPPNGKPLISTRTKTTDYIRNVSTRDSQSGIPISKKSIRKTLVIPTNEDDEIGEIWIEKTQLWQQVNEDYPFRVALSTEVEIEPINEEFKPDVIRTKNRVSYLIFNGNMRLDLTMVDMINEDNVDSTQYELELEILNITALSNLQTAASVVLLLLLDTVELYTRKERNDIVNYVNDILGGWDRGIIDHRPIVQARNLKLRDMVWGGLIGNEYTSYTVTHKTDGIRKLLVIHRSGVWLVMAPSEINKVTSQSYRQLEGYILDGEYVPNDGSHRIYKNGAPICRIWYNTFDCLSAPFEQRGQYGDTSVQNYPHKDRMIRAQIVADYLKSTVIQVITKTFREFRTAEEFFTIMSEMFAEQPNLSYKQDGFLFTPAYVMYNPHSDKYKLSQRVLTRYPDICKWKPKEQLTIDFLICPKIVNAVKTIELYSTEQIVDNDRNNRNNRSRQVRPACASNIDNTPLVRFTGTSSYPFSNEIDMDNPLTMNVPNRTIVEYRWDYERRLFVPERIRHDKTKPNRNEIAIDVWEDIHDPIDENVLTGNSFRLLRKYHNRIKSELFRIASKNVIYGRRTLLDIGSGRGGDVRKWLLFDKIVAVEPNDEHIVELQRRIDEAGITDRVKIVKAGGEDTEIITREVINFIGERVSTVSMMLSLSFFWENENKIDRLLSTILSNISQNGEFIFLTIDGSAVEQTFDPAFRTGLPLNVLKLGPATLKYDDTKNPPTLDINIDNTIVQNQTEWLVYIEDLSVVLERYGFNLRYVHRADKENFLSLHEQIFTSMYTYGIYSNVNNVKSDIITGLPYVINVNREQLPGPEDLISKMEDLNIQNPLPIIQVKADFTNDRGIGDDTYEQLNLSWYNLGPVVRISCLGGNLSILHAILKATYNQYADTPSLSDRVNIVNGLDAEIKQINQNPDLELLSNVLGINIYVLIGDDQDLYYDREFLTGYDNSKSIVLLKSGQHYEVIAIDDGKYFQTIYYVNDPFIESVRSISQL